MTHRFHLLAAGLAASVALAGCSTSGEPTAAAGGAIAGGTKATVVAANAAGAAAVAAAPNGALPACTRPISGPPPKPAKGGDFVKHGVGGNLKRNVARNGLTMLGGMVGGGLGAAVASGVAADRVRTAEDVDGRWTATDGAGNCGCQVELVTGVRAPRFNGRDTIRFSTDIAKKGGAKAGGCRSPLLASAKAFGLGHTFTGYNAPFELRDARGNKIATMKRDGINYFSGTMSDGTPVTLWRRTGKRR